MPTCRLCPVIPRVATDTATATGMASSARWLRVAALGMCSALFAIRAGANEIGIFGLIGAYRTDNGQLTSSGQKSDNVGWLSFGTYGKWESDRLRTRWSLGEDAVKYFN